MNAAANKVYTASYGGNSVTVINGATNTILSTIGGYPGALTLAVNPLTHKVFVACSTPGTQRLGVLDGTTQAVSTDHSSPSGVGMSPVDIAVDFIGKKIYIAHLDTDDVWEIIGGARISLGSGADPHSLALDPIARCLYIAESGHDQLTIVNTGDNSIVNRCPVGDMPIAVRVNPVTRKIYVVNHNSDSVSVIADGDTCATTRVPVGDGPTMIDINTHTDKVYVVNHNGNSVTRIDGATDATRTIGLFAGASPTDVAVNPVTNRIYVTNYNRHTITVINGASDTVASNFAVGTGRSYPVRVAVNPVTNKIYVTDWGSDQVSIIDGATNNVVNRSSMGTHPRPLAVNVATNKIYVVNTGTNNLTVIDGAQDRVVYSGLILGGGAIAIVPLLDGAVTVNVSSSTVSFIRSQQNTNPLQLWTTIGELPGHTARGATVYFNFTARSDYSPTAPPVRQIYFQADTLTGRWLRATPDGASGSGSTPSLTRGLHFVYAFAVDGQEATSVNTGLQSSPIPGRLTLYQFLVTEARLHLPIITR